MDYGNRFGPGTRGQLFKLRRGLERPLSPHISSTRASAARSAPAARRKSAASAGVRHKALTSCSKASASLLTENVKGKTKAEAEQMFERVRELVTTGKAEGDVGKLAVFAGVYKYPARVKCAILSWHALMSALKGDQQPVSTESEQN